MKVIFETEGEAGYMNTLVNKEGDLLPKAGQLVPCYCVASGSTIFIKFETSY